MDSRKLKGIVLQKFFSITNFAAAMKWSRNKATRILNGVSEPTIDDIVGMTEVLELDEKTFFVIFLAGCPQCVHQQLVKEGATMLTQKEQEELEALKKDPLVKLATKSLKRPVDPDKKRLYQYRWLRKKGQKIAEEIERELPDKE